MMPILDSASVCHQVRYQITVQGALSCLPGGVLGSMHAAEHLLPVGPVTVLTGILPNSGALLDLLIGLHRAGALLLVVTSREYTQTPNRTSELHMHAATPEATAQLI